MSQNHAVKRPQACGRFFGPNVFDAGADLVNHWRAQPA
jgi:hypothetical protein